MGAACCMAPFIVYASVQPNGIGTIILMRYHVSVPPFLISFVYN